MGVLDKYSDEELFVIFDADVQAELRKRGYEFGWHKNETYAGCVYILVNPAFPNLVKIGYSDGVESRVKQLNANSGLPAPYHVYATYQVKKRLIDLKLHSLIDMLNPKLKYTSNREFYEMSAEDAFDLLSGIAEITGTESLLVRNPLGDDYFVSTKSEPHTEHVEPGHKRSAQPPFRFDEFGINEGSVLEFYDARKHQARPDITAVVTGPRSIMCDGETTSLSKKAQEICGLKHGPRGTEYWTWNGRRLVEIYQEKYPKPNKAKDE